MKWNGVEIVNISREFLNTNGAEKHTDVYAEKSNHIYPETVNSFFDSLKKTVSDLNVCSQKGLVERFDSTIGAGSVLLPYGGKYQLTPAQVMAAKIPSLEGECSTA